MNVIGDLLQQGIIGNVKCRNDKQFVGRKIGSLRKDKVGADVRLIERAVQLREDGILCRPRPYPAPIPFPADDVMA